MHMIQVKYGFPRRGVILLGSAHGGASDAGRGSAALFGVPASVSPILSAELIVAGSFVNPELILVAF